MLLLEDHLLHPPDLVLVLPLDLVLDLVLGRCLALEAVSQPENSILKSTGLGGVVLRLLGLNGMSLSLHFLPSGILFDGGASVPNGDG